MSNNKNLKSVQTTATPVHQNVDDKLHFEGEQTVLSSDPVPKVGAFSGSISDSDEDGDAIKNNPFLDSDVAAHWVDAYEKADYECRHVFDPSLTWSEEEEKKLVRRLDWHVCLWAVSGPGTQLIRRS
jgi:hypothetical protein